MKSLFFLPIFIIITFFLSACGGIPGGVFKNSFNSVHPDGSFEVQTEACKLLSILKNNNYNLKTFKGIGKARLTNSGITQTVRIAWIGSEPEKIRIEILDVSGLPAVSFANDGKKIYFADHTRSSFYKKRSKNANLKKIILIPIKSCDIITLLTGRIPIHKYDVASIIHNKYGNGYILILMEKRHRIIEKIYLDDNKTDVRKVELFNEKGSIMYRAEFEQMQIVAGYPVPLKLVISNNDTKFQLDFDKYLVNMPVLPSVFVLTPPE